MKLLYICHIKYTYIYSFILFGGIIVFCNVCDLASHTHTALLLCFEKNVMPKTCLGHLNLGTTAKVPC